ncbi:FG-GAP-like repeat-containing protein [Micromonospora coerulea]|uniref:FG-GAP-like repeat-containing protein n=1 Tax=Micromonospora coerulea TaxID=47856 RepID=UPI001907D09F|nr:FG-GAP-like repeat-containing protein [Micromonospora veneta]
MDGPTGSFAGTDAATGIICLALFLTVIAVRSRKRRGWAGRSISWPLGLAIGVVGAFIIMGAVWLAAVDDDEVAGTAGALPSPAPQEGGLDAETSPTGSFTTSFPIRVPAFHGIEPGLSLEYDSGAGNEELGVGWSLGVDPGIVRSGPRGALPRYDASDVFLLNGDELVRCAPSCSTGGTHEARRRTFERITFDGRTWTRWQRSGVKHVYESYDEPPGSMYRWPLRSVTDTHGNTVSYGSSCPADHCYLATITYASVHSACGDAGQPQCKAGAEIRFFFEPRPDWTAYPTGKKTAYIDQRLKSVDVRMDGDRLAAYALQYDTSPVSGDSVLRSVQQFPHDAAVAPDGTITAGPTPPLPGTTLRVGSTATPAPRWKPDSTPGTFTIATPPGKPDLPAIETSVPGNIAHWSPDGDDNTTQSPLQGDFDGDGLLDVASWRTGLSCSPLYVRLGRAPRPLRNTPFTGGCPAAGLVTDLDGDGIDDIMLMSDRGSIEAAISQRDGTFVEQTHQATPWASQPGTAVKRRCATGDLNNDDLGDVVCAYERGLEPPRLGIVRSTADAGFVITDEPLPGSAGFLEDVLLTIGDVDASGTGDIMLAVGVHKANWSLITGYTQLDGTVQAWRTTATSWARGERGQDFWQLSGGDFDGDARRDYVLITGSVVYIATSEKGASPPQTAKPVVLTSAGEVTVGDYDADGRDDLLTGNPVGGLRSKGDGSFADHQVFPTANDRACEELQVLSAADVNGDGQADLVCSWLTAGPDGRPAFAMWAQPSPVAAPASHRWAPLDVDGDGRQDLYTVHYRNPGYQVYVQHAKPDGGYELTGTPILPSTGGPGLDEPNAAGWMAMDVGGPDSTPDGRSDLVLLSQSGSTLHAVTLLSTDKGWRLVPTAGDAAVGVAVPGLGWQPADLNGDELTDLVHFTALPNGVRLDYLLATGDGTWTRDTADRTYFTSAAPTGGPLRRADVGSFRVTDRNHDGVSDFVHIEVGGTAATRYRTIRTLISTTATTWAEQTDYAAGPFDPAAAHGLQPMEFDGDGLPDLGRAVAFGGCVRVEAYVNVTGQWSRRTADPPAPCQPAGGLEDLTNLALTDVNEDGATDVRLLARAGARTDGSVMLNPGGPGAWHWVPEPALPVTHPDTWAYIAFDTDHDGHGELAHVNPNDLSTLSWVTTDDRLTTISNGQGATTSVAHRTQPDARTYLPVGTLPVVVDRITVTDAAHQPPITATAAFEYDTAAWSIRHRQMLGYGTIRSLQGDTTSLVGNDLSDACGVRQSSHAMIGKIPPPETAGNPPAAFPPPKSTDTLPDLASGGIIASTATLFASPGSVAPFTCRPETTTRSECELRPLCRHHVTTYGYDDYGNLETIAENSGAGLRRTHTPVHPNTTDYIVDRPYKRETLIPDPAGPNLPWLVQARTLFGYDQRGSDEGPARHGDLTRITEYSDLKAGDAAETFHQYDAAGNLEWTRDPVGVVTTTGYDPHRKLFPTSTCTPVGCTSLEWDEALGAVRAATDLNNQTTRTDYDPYGRPAQTTRPDGTITRITYPDPGVVTGPDRGRQRTRTEISDGSSVDGVHWHEDLLDGLGRVYRSLDEGTTADPANVLITDTRYADASTRPAATALQHTAAEAPQWTRYIYDAAHRRTAVIHPGADVRRTRTYRIGAVDDRDELGHQITTLTDSFGRRTGVDEFDRLCSYPCRPIIHHTAYTYDALDRLTTITDAAGNQTKIVRDALGRETSITDPDRGTRTLTWRPNGTLDNETDANGVHTWTYDAAGRPETRQDKNTTGTSNTVWHYDREGSSGPTRGFSLGRLVQVDYQSSRGDDKTVIGSDRFWYDRLGQTTRTERFIDRVRQEMNFAYDPAGRLLDVHYPDPANPAGEHVVHSYDAAGRLRSVGAYLTVIKRNSAGQPETRAYGNGLVESLSYDPARGWLDTHALTRPSPGGPQPLYAATYHHDETARVFTQTISNAAGPTGQLIPLTQSFGYDARGRLTSHSTSEGTSGAFTYDSIGKITSSPAAGTYSYDDPAHVHAVTGTSSGHERMYDAGGNLTKLVDPAPGGRSLDITWTPTGMPHTVTAGQTRTTYAYGPDNQRVKRDTGASATRFFDRYLEHSSTGGLTRHYWAGDQLLATRNPAGAVTYVFQDRQHSTRLTADHTGAVTARYNYEPYGKEKPGNPADATSMRWQGQHTDPDNGLVHMKARYYDPELGQFTAADTIIPEPYNPQTLHRYGFGDGDPVNRWDPTGHMSMRVELKKEQEQQGLRQVAGYAKLLILNCAQGVTACQAGWVPSFTRWHAEGCLDGPCSVSPKDQSNPKAKAGGEGQSGNGQASQKELSGTIIVGGDGEEISFTNADGQTVTMKCSGERCYPTKIGVSDEKLIEICCPAPTSSSQQPAAGFGFGGWIGTLGEAGLGYGASAQATVGNGIYWGGEKGLNMGSYVAGGTFVGGGPGGLSAPAAKDVGVLGVGAGVGAGLFITNASSVADLAGPFEVKNLGFTIINLQYATDGRIWQFSFGVAKSTGASVSWYRTTTVPISTTAK